MKTFKMEQDWLKRVLPEGLTYPGSTVISGPGATGKPLVEYAFVASWLKAGGSAISVPLQYPTTDFVDATIKSLYGIDLKEYAGKLAYIQFEPTIDSYEDLGDNRMKVNLLKPEMWDEAIEKLEGKIEKTEMGTLVFGSALNLLLFSPTYKAKALEKLTDIIKNDKSRSYMFSISTSAYAKEIKQWEEVADNLMFTRMEDGLNLSFYVTRMKDVGFSKEEVDVPISEEQLKQIQEIAQATRDSIMPKLVKI